ncbi:MAG: AMP-binding protein [Rhodobacterales bacterium]
MQTLYDALRQIAVDYGDSPFLCVPPRSDRHYLPQGAEITFAEMLAAVDTLADAWERAGWGEGHRIALALDNHPAHVMHFLALNRLGVSQVPVNPYYLKHEMAYLLDHSEADAAVALPWNRDKIRQVSDIPVASWDDPTLAAAFDPPRAPRPAQGVTPGINTEIALIYTSGTTSRPKGAIIDNDYAFAVGRLYAAHGGALTVRDGVERIFIPLPYFHVNAGINTLALALLKGVCLIVPDRFHAETWWDDLAATRATAIHYLGIIPPVLMKAAPGPQDRRHGLRYGLGAGLDPALHRAFEERFGLPMVEVWGMTETGRFLADCHEPRQTDTRAFGRPLPDHLLARVVDEAGQDVPPGTAGELVVRAPGPDPRQGFFKGYLKNEEATEDAWRDGWFHTGDVVTQGADGMLMFVERAKNIIRRSGENISAAEVENALIDCPAVAAVAVIAVADAMRDEEVFAAIVPATGHAPGHATAETVLDFARDRLAYYKLPGWIVFRDSLPVTGTQKVQKHRLYPVGVDPCADPAAIDLREAKSLIRKAKA